MEVSPSIDLYETPFLQRKPGEDDVLQAADAVLAQQPDATATATPKSTLTSDVHELMEYLDALRVTPHHLMEDKENDSLTKSQSGKKQRYGASKTPLQTPRIKEVKEDTIPASSPTHTIPHNTREIFRPLNHLEEVHEIFKAGSVHSCAPAAVSFLNSSDHHFGKEHLSHSDLLSALNQIQVVWNQVCEERQSTREWSHQVRARVEQWIVQERKLLLILQDQKDSNVLQQQARQIRELQTKLDQVTKSTPMPRVSPKSAATVHDASFTSSMYLEEGASPALPLQPQTAVRSKRFCELLENGRRVHYRNGTTRDYLDNGTKITRYVNGDVATTSSESKVYWHEAEQTKQTTFADGMVIYEYPNHQVERHYVDGRKEVSFV